MTNPYLPAINHITRMVIERKIAVKVYSDLQYLKDDLSEFEKTLEELQVLSDYWQATDGRYNH